MEAAAKPARAGGGSAPDRLSALPDELLRHVLSFLRSRQAVQTTVLSKRWVDLWRSVPAIDLDVTDFPENNSSIYVNWGKMKDFSTKLLMFHSAQFLDAVRLRLGIFDSRNHLRDDVDVWVRCLIKHQPLVLDITVSRSFGLRFQIPLVDSPFRRLKTLELYGVFVDHGFKERLNSGCPVLEDLALHRCRNEFVAIQSDTLKNLVVHGCTCRSELLVIKAPCLISLSLKFPHGCYTNGISLQAGNSLAKASISIYCTELSQSGQTILLGGLSDVTSLELYGFSAMVCLPC
ncbi:hypothetical protein HU200_013928 [Digitaria exilis]|uniref:F-box domain-containing protein n=1 Tax=Digitaria exilis TaxID=1010633 RepID=A0A835FCA8_9POAL|nr:hypothetical protein HU200_013928 [Digitaria exilis]